MDENQIKEYTEIVIKMAVQQAPKILLAIVVLIAGLWIIRKATKTIGILLEKRNTDPSLIPFLKSVLSIGMKVALLITVIGMMGIETTSFIAMLGAAGLAIGMALSGTLQNFAGGVILLLFKPFKVGDFVEVQGYTGTVSVIQIFHTILKTVDNKTVIIPNGSLANGAMTNFTTEPIRRVDMRFSISYKDNIDKAKSILYRVMSEDIRVHKEPAPFVGLVELGNSSVNFVVRPWVNAADYWPVHFDIHEKVKKAFDAEGVSIPFPQMDVHLPSQKLDK
jgi:small conductance mechanosensitive channel